jgi:hypothetical protein
MRLCTHNKGQRGCLCNPQVMLNGVAVDSTTTAPSSAAPAPQRKAKKAGGVGGVVAPARRLKLQPMCGKRQTAVSVSGSALEPACKKLRGVCVPRPAETFRAAETVSTRVRFSRVAAGLLLDNVRCRAVRVAETGCGVGRCWSSTRVPTGYRHVQLLPHGALDGQAGACVRGVAQSPPAAHLQQRRRRSSRPRRLPGDHSRPGSALSGRGPSSLA